MMPDPSGMSIESGRIYKKGREPKKKKDEQVDQSQKIFLTKPEQKLYQIIRSLNIPLRLFAQYQQHVAGNQNAFMLDFAFPDIMLNLEADGDFWHSDFDALERDKERDLKLASLGWRVVRIRESALNTNAQMVTQVVINNIKEAIAQRKAMMAKRASVEDESIAYEDGEDVKIAFQNLIYHNEDND